jgi:hypothetical protein
MRKSGYWTAPSRQGWEGLLAFFLHGDLELAEEFGILVGQMELGTVPLFGRQFLPVHKIGLTPLVEPDRDFEDQEEVVTCRPDTPHDLGNPIGVGEGLVDSASQFLNQAFKIVIEVQKFTKPL